MCLDRSAFIGGTYLARRDESDGAHIECRPIVDVVSSAAELLRVAKVIRDTSSKLPRVP